MQRGHRGIASTLRTEEVSLLDHLTRELEEARQRRRRRQETYRLNDNTKITRAGVIRGAIRFTLEHRDDFIAWTERDTNAR